LGDLSSLKRERVARRFDEALRELAAAIGYDMNAPSLNGQEQAKS